MSNINTSTINTSFPVPGTNNSTQGFRDNFTSISTNLDTAASEISDLQHKAILKTALNGTIINNDMANTIISNAQTKGFRASSYNLGSSLPVNPNVIIIDVSSADVHFGILAGNTSFVFGGWSPTSTQSVIELHLFVDAANTAPGSTISFPNTTYNSSGVVLNGMTKATQYLENYSALYVGTVGANGTSVINGSTAVFGPESTMNNVVHTNTVTIPAGVVELQYEFVSLDCGTTIDVRPLNRGHKASSITVRTPGATGLRGDVPGTICSDGTNMYLCILPYDGTTVIWKKIALTSI